jgi:hypothetical protein
MTVDWQTWAALALTFSALGFVLHRAWQMWRGEKSGCGSGCKSCAEEKPLVTIDLTAHKSSRS